MKTGNYLYGVAAVAVLLFAASAAGAQGFCSGDGKCRCRPPKVHVADVHEVGKVHLGSPPSVFDRKAEKYVWQHRVMVGPCREVRIAVGSRHVAPVVHVFDAQGRLIHLAAPQVVHPPGKQGWVFGTLTSFYSAKGQYYRIVVTSLRQKAKGPLEYVIRTHDTRIIN